MSVLVAGSLVLSAAGCARGPGHGFGEIAGVTLDVLYAPDIARDLGDGWALTDQGYRVHLDRFEVDTSELLLEQNPGAGGDTSFDPANPLHGGWWQPQMVGFMIGNHFCRNIYYSPGRAPVSHRHIGYAAEPLAEAIGRSDYNVVFGRGAPVVLESSSPLSDVAAAARAFPIWPQVEEVS